LIEAAMIWNEPNKRSIEAARACFCEHPPSQSTEKEAHGLVDASMD
jgi:hypothetical protein